MGRETTHHTVHLGQRNGSNEGRTEVAGRARVQPRQDNSRALSKSLEKSRHLLSERRHLYWLIKGRRYSRYSHKPLVSGSLLPRPVFTKMTILSIIPIPKGLIELVIFQQNLSVSSLREPSSLMSRKAIDSQSKEQSGD